MMAGAPPKEFRWQTEPVTRAPKIEPEVWELYKEELCRAYQTITLNELMAQFKQRYDFAPSRRQYIHQFSAWGLQKYGKAKATSSRMAPSIAPKPASLSQYSKMDVDVVRSSGPPLSAAKRAAQTPSLRSLQSDLSRPPKPAKNPKLASWAASKTMYTGPEAARTGAFDSTVASVEWNVPGHAETHRFGGPRHPRISTGVLNFEGGFGPPRDPTTATGFVEDTIYKSKQRGPETGLPEKGYFDAYEHGRSVSRSPFHATQDDESIMGYNPGTTEPFPRFEQDHDMTSSPFHDDDNPFADENEAYNDPYDDPYYDEADGVYGYPDETGSWVTVTGQAAVSLFDDDENGVDHDNQDYPLNGIWKEPNAIQSAKNNKIDPSRPIHEYKLDEIKNMKAAADYLFCLLFHEDAFPIYSIVKQWLQHNNRSAIAINDAGIACARCPSSDGQDQIVRSFLEPKLDETKRDISAAERFTSRMLMAETYARTVNIDEAKGHIEEAMKSSMTANILDTLPIASRTLDLLTYHNLTRCLRPNTTDEVAAHVPDFRYNHDAAERMDECENMILTRVPGPFEIQAGSMDNPEETMQNPCLRSCLQWCSEQMKDTSKMPGMWKDMKREHSSLRCAQCIALFTWLWHRWQVTKTPASDPSEDIWKTDTLRRMGISPTELLITVCWVINEASGVTSSSNDKERIADVRKACASVMEMPDRAVAMNFLECFACRNGLERPTGERVAFEKVAREHARSLLQRVMAILLPDIQGTIAWSINRSHQSFQRALKDGVDASAAYASSLRSSDWSNFQGVANIVKAAAEGRLSDELRFQMPSLMMVGGNGSGGNLGLFGALVSMSSLSISDASRASRASGYEMMSVRSGATARRKQERQDDGDDSSQRRLLDKDHSD